MLNNVSSTIRHAGQRLGTLPAPPSPPIYFSDRTPECQFLTVSVYRGVGGARLSIDRDRGKVSTPSTPCLSIVLIGSSKAPSISQPTGGRLSHIDSGSDLSLQERNLLGTGGEVNK